ncbi:hypothetical protein INR49_009424 [Caranx melampygus]|nr:hypothetical protein INR49_009424 [Caranx melampygus]
MCLHKGELKKMTVKSYLLWIATFLLILLTGGGEDKVRCVEGETCTLPCSFKPGTVHDLHWTHTERDDPVHSYYNNKDQVEYQVERFKGRTSLPKDLSTGDASLQLRKVQVQDQGRYKCTVKTKEKNESVINLEVKGMRYF